MEKQPEIGRYRRLLKQISKIATEASMTGALSDGNPVAIEQYNRILERLSAKGFDPDGLFPPLPEDASFDRVGVAAEMLSAYLVEDEGESPATRLPNIVIGNLGSLSELEKLKDLGKQIRENLPEWMREKEAGDADRMRAEADRIQAEADRMRAEADRLRANARRAGASDDSEAETVRANPDAIPMPDLAR
ncbi:MAG: hypothetical protein SFU56_08030 [Capsulimonadales bacterium]|nr:hypothetical protein [Capsulimonadales bacterium]